MLVGRMRLQTDIWKFPADGLPAANVRRVTRVTHQTGQVLTPTAGRDDRRWPSYLTAAVMPTCGW